MLKRHTCKVCDDELELVSNFTIVSGRVRFNGDNLRCNNKYCALVREYLSIFSFNEDDLKKEVDGFGSSLKKEDRSEESYLKLLRARKALGVSKKSNSSFAHYLWDNCFEVDTGKFDVLLLHVMNDIAREKDRSRKKVKVIYG